MKKLLLIIPLMLSPAVAQARKPEVIQLSPDTYMITKADHGGIFGGGIPAVTNGGVLTQTASSGTLDLGNAGGDTVALYNANSKLILIYIYGNEGNDNQSITRFPDIFGNDPLVKHGTVNGSLFSPGTLTNGLPFSGCNP